MVGTLLGATELAGWLSRLIGGILVDRTGRYSLVVKIGYAGLIVVPLLSLAHDLLALALLVFAERTLRGLRVPARDVMLARLRGEVGLGITFGIHEFLDQIGAVAGPIFVALVIALLLDHRQAFLMLAIPYALLLVAVSKLPSYSERRGGYSLTSVSRQTVFFSLSAGFSAAGLLPLPIVLYLVSQGAGLGSWLVPSTYVVAMVLDALAALVLGGAFEKLGPKVLMVVMVSAVVPPLIIGDLEGLFLAAGIVGVVIGAQESVFRSMVASLASKGNLATSYAIYGLAIGGGGTVAGFVFGLMADTGAIPLYMFAYSAVLQMVAVLLLYSSLARPDQRGVDSCTIRS